MSYLNGDTLATMDEWYERIRKWPQHKLLWHSPVADEIKAWAVECLPEGQWVIYDLFVTHVDGMEMPKQPDPMCIAICFATDTLAVQFRLSFPEVEWWDHEGWDDKGFADEP